MPSEYDNPERAALLLEASRLRVEQAVHAHNTIEEMRGRLEYMERTIRRREASLNSEEMREYFSILTAADGEYRGRINDYTS